MHHLVNSQAHREWQVVNKDVIEHLNMLKSQETDDAACVRQKRYTYRLTDEAFSIDGKKKKRSQQFDFEKHKV